MSSGEVDVSDMPFPPSLQYLLLQPSFPPHDGQVTSGRFDGRLMGEFVQNVNGSDRHPLEDAHRTYRGIVFATITGKCLIAVQGPRNHFSTNFGSDLRVEGVYQGRVFTFVAPHFYCRREPGFSDSEEWVLFEPVNSPAVLTYQTAGKVTHARCLQLNFTIERDASQPTPPLLVQACGREISFAPAPMSPDVLRLLRVGGIASAPTTVIRFPVNETDAAADVAGLAWNATKFCGLVAQQFTPPIRLEWVDANEEPARIEFYSTVRSTFNKRGGYLLVGLDFPKGGLADFFSECFDEFIRLQQDAKWRRLFNFAWAYEDTVFLECRIGTVMIAVELLLRLSLEEAGETMRGRLLDDKDPPGIGDLISAARGRLRWDIQKHYTKLERYRKIRNAIAHGRDLPCTTREALDFLQKWGLFLYRRLFMRLGYTREIWSASKGFSTTSGVADFREEVNDFTPSEVP
jgi:hypothetical protein